ncbi:MAG: L-2-amino-thiazoline-4-carboxylic acid hydrolase [Dehalococcoidia bacterium]
MGVDDMDVLKQRRIEAPQVLGPVIRAFQKELGEARANEVVRRAIEDLTLREGQELARRAGKNDLRSFAAETKAWYGDLEKEVLEDSPTQFSFNVTRCQYAEMYRELGLQDLGFLLSCNRDFFRVKGFNPKVRLDRTQTIMQGAPHCDFRYSQGSE